MRGKIPFLILITLASCSPAAPEQARQIPPLPSVNVANYFPEVREQVQKAFERADASPQSARANGELGMVFDTYEQYDSARLCYRRAHEFELESFRWTYYLGWVQAALGEYGEAESTLREALRQNPGYLPAQLKLAEALSGAGKWDESGKLYASLAKRYPELAVARYGLGRARWARHEEAAAAESFLRACELFPPYGAAHYALALAYRKLGDADKAREHFKLYEQNRTAVPGVEDPLRKAVEDLNLGPLGHMRRGVALEEAGKTTEAIAEEEKALDANPSIVQLHINLVSLYGKLNEFQKAEQHYRAAVSLNPNQAEAYYNYGVLLFRHGRNAEAEQAFREVLRINPFYAEAHNNLGVLLEQKGQLDEAMEQFQEAIVNRPNYCLAHFHAGRILVNQGKYEAAIPHFLLALSPEDESTPRYLYALGATYARAGDRAKALQYLRKARDAAAARAQNQLLESVERDLATLEESK